MIKIILIVLAVAVVGGGAFFVLGGRTISDIFSRGEANESATPSVSVPPTESTAPNGATAKSFTITTGRYLFTPNQIRVQQGDTVRITLKNPLGKAHDLQIDAFNAATRELAAGEEQTIEFVADKVGSFEIYCSERGMEGTLIVEA